MKSNDLHGIWKVCKDLQTVLTAFIAKLKFEVCVNYVSYASVNF